MEELPRRWNIGSGGRPALTHEPTLHDHAEFYWDDRMEFYLEAELKQKIESEGRSGDDPFVKAYNRLREMAPSDATRFPRKLKKDT